MAIGDVIRDLFSNIGKVTKEAILNPDIQFGLFFFLLFFMALAFLKFGLQHTFMKDNEKQANVVAIAIAGLLCLGLFVGVRDPVSQVTIILEKIRVVGTAIIGLGAFLAFRSVFQDIDFLGHNIKNHVGVFALGLGLWFGGGIGDYDTAVGWGNLFMGISMAWLFGTIFFGEKSISYTKITKRMINKNVKKLERIKEDDEEFNNKLGEAINELERAKASGLAEIRLIETLKSTEKGMEDFKKQLDDVKLNNIEVKNDKNKSISNYKNVGYDMAEIFSQINRLR